MIKKSLFFVSLIIPKLPIQICLFVNDSSDSIVFFGLSFEAKLKKQIFNFKNNSITSFNSEIILMKRNRTNFSFSISI